MPWRCIQRSAAERSSARQHPAHGQHLSISTTLPERWQYTQHLSMCDYACQRGCGVCRGAAFSGAQRSAAARGSTRHTANICQYRQLSRSDGSIRNISRCVIMHARGGAGCAVALHSAERSGAQQRAAAPGTRPTFVNIDKNNCRYSLEQRQPTNHDY